MQEALNPLVHSQAHLKAKVVLVRSAPDHSGAAQVRGLCQPARGCEGQGRAELTHFSVMQGLLGFTMVSLASEQTLSSAVLRNRSTSQLRGGLFRCLYFLEVCNFLKHGETSMAQDQIFIQRYKVHQQGWGTTLYNPCDFIEELCSKMQAAHNNLRIKDNISTGQVLSSENLIIFSLNFLIDV